MPGRLAARSSCDDAPGPRAVTRVSEGADVGELCGELLDLVDQFGKVDKK
jgi:hypothetical protein